jgi:hypothetical protein
MDHISSRLREREFRQKGRPEEHVGSQGINADEGGQGALSHKPEWCEQAKRDSVVVDVWRGFEIAETLTFKIRNSL